MIEDLFQILLRICEQHAPDIRDARALAHHEARASNLPGRVNGPQDAYRHILVAAELTRRLGGPELARAGLDLLELYGRYCTEPRQPAESEAMDRYNNEFGYQIGQVAQSWEQVVTYARERINPNRVGQDWFATWLPQDRWKDPSDNPQSNWNWPNIGAFRGHTFVFC